MKKKRTHHGVILEGCSGRSLRWEITRGEADRIRRVVRAWKAKGGWTGWRTLGKLANFAGDSSQKWRRTGLILKEFEEIGRECGAMNDEPMWWWWPVLLALFLAAGLN